MDVRVLSQKNGLGKHINRSFLFSCIIIGPFKPKMQKSATTRGSTTEPMGSNPMLGPSHSSGFACQGSRSRQSKLTLKSTQIHKSSLKQSSALAPLNFYKTNIGPEPNKRFARIPTGTKKASFKMRGGENFVKTWRNFVNTS